MCQRNEDYLCHDQNKAHTLVIVDGYRWEALFGGVDSLLIHQKDFGDVAVMKQRYPSKGHSTERKLLSKQIAPTLAKKLGIEFHPAHERVGPPIEF